MLLPGTREDVLTSSSGCLVTLLALCQRISHFSFIRLLYLYLLCLWVAFISPRKVPALRLKTSPKHKMYSLISSTNTHFKSCGETCIYGTVNFAFF